MASSIDVAAGKVIDALLEEELLEFDIPTDGQIEEARKRVEEKLQGIVDERVKEFIDKIKQLNKPTTSRRTLFGLKE